MTIRLAAPLQSDSVVDGFGVRTVIWTQGCSHNCPFCQNPGTHSFTDGEEYDLKDIFKELDELPVTQNGITLSGGDPLFQIDPVVEIAKYAKSIGLNVWCYTGFTYEKLLELSKEKPIYKEFLSNIDVLIDGPFVLSKKSFDCTFRGSTNQRIIDTKKSLETGNIVVITKYDKKIKNEEKECIFI